MQKSCTSWVSVGSPISLQGFIPYHVRWFSRRILEPSTVVQIVQWKIGVSRIGSLHFKGLCHFPLNQWENASSPVFWHLSCSTLHCQYYPHVWLTRLAGWQKQVLFSFDREANHAELFVYGEKKGAWNEKEHRVYDMIWCASGISTWFLFCYLDRIQVSVPDSPSLTLCGNMKSPLGKSSCF